MIRPLTLAAAILIAAAPLHAQEAAENPLQPGATWDRYGSTMVGKIAIADGTGVFDLDAPYRAHDAATVPVRLTQPGALAERITALTLIVDENPSPVVAEFSFGPGMGELALETRVRVDQYSNVRAIATTESGAHVMSGRYVKASGGCSAPAAKDAAAALAALGQMKLRQFPLDAATVQSPIRREAQVMLRHPNYSGLQRDQVTHLFIGAHYVDTLEVWQGDELIFSMEGGISISENPSFRFTYTDNGAAEITVRATDTEGAAFEGHFAKDAVSG